MEYPPGPRQLNSRPVAPDQRESTSDRADQAILRQGRPDVVVQTAVLAEDLEVLSRQLEQLSSEARHAIESLDSRRGPKGGAGT